MRFFFVDRIRRVERGRRLVAERTATVMDEYLSDHYPRMPMVPATLVLESVAQAGGWLNLLTWDFQVKTILVMCERVRVQRQVYAGDHMVLDVHLLHAHQDGASMQGEVRVDEDLVMSVDRIVFAHEVDTRDEFVREQRERLYYVSGGTDALTRAEGDGVVPPRARGATPRTQ